MNIITKERQDIEERIAWIKSEKEKAGLDAPVEISAGIPVLKEHSKEHKILVRLLEIIDNNMAQDGINEYLDKRGQVELPPLPESERSVFKNPMTQRMDELDRINKEMRGIVSDSKVTMSPKERASDGNMVVSTALPNYETLYAMKTIVNRGFRTQDYYEYYDLCAKSSLGPISEGKLQSLMGRAPLASEKRTEEELANVNAEKIDDPVQKAAEVPKQEIAQPTPKIVEEQPTQDVNPPIWGQAEVEPPKPQYNLDIDEPAREQTQVETKNIPETPKPFETSEQPIEPSPRPTDDIQDITKKEEETSNPIIDSATPAESQVHHDNSGIPKSEETSTEFPNPEPSREDELKKEHDNILANELLTIQTRKNAIKSLYRFSNDPAPRTTSDGSLVQNEYYEEYETLLSLEKNVNTNFQNTDIENYRNLRNKTKLQPLEDGLYQIMFTRTHGIDATGPNNLNFAGAVEGSKAYKEVVQESAYFSEEETNGLNPNGELNEEKLTGAVEGPKAYNYKANSEEEKIEKPKKLFKVIGSRAWQWTKDHKKEILIALGLAAIGVSVVVALTQLLPAYAAATQATQVAAFAQEMVANSALHLTSNATEKVALHAANRSIANIITGITGMANNFNTTTYAWTFAGQPIADFVTTSVANAAAATAKVSSLTNISTFAGLGGLGTIGAGLILPKRSQEFKNYKEHVNELVDTASTRTNEEQLQAIQNLSNKVLLSETLEQNEKMIIFRKLQKAIANVRTSEKKEAQAGNNINPEEVDPQLVNSDIPEENIEKVEAELINPEDLPFSADKLHGSKF